MRTPETPRERRRAERIDTIKEEALALVIEDGIESFSVHRLADRLDLTVGALYRYFESVDHLLSAVQVDVLESFDVYFEGLEEALGQKGPGTLQWVVNMTFGYMALSALEPVRFRLIARFVSSLDPMLNDDAAASAVEPAMRLLGRMAIAIERAQDAEELCPGDAFDRTVLMWSCMQGLMERRKLTRLHTSLFDFGRMSEELMATLLIGWGADSEQVWQAIQNRATEESFRKVLEKQR